MDAIAKEIDELETKDAVQSSSIKAKKLIDSDNFKTQNFDSSHFQTLRTNLFNAIAEVNKWKRVIISLHDAQDQAKLEYMSKAEREIWQQYSSTVAHIHHLKQFLQTLRQPKESQSDALKAYNELVAGVKKKIIALNSSVGLMEKSVANINRRLESPDCKKNILLVTHHFLQENMLARKKLKQAGDNLDMAVDDLQNAIFSKAVYTDNKDFFKTREVYDAIRHQFFSLKKEYEKILDSKFDLQQKIISPQRAIAMAKNIFVDGDLKALRADLRQFLKSEQLFAKNLSDLNQREKNFLTRDWSGEDRPLFLQEKYVIDKQKILLEIEHQRLSNLKNSLDYKAAKLEQLCRLPDSQEKIQDIATGILRKNFKFVRRLEETESRLKQLSQRINHSKQQLDALKLQLKIDNRHTCYKVISSDNSSSAASIIADAILREPSAVQLVARSYDNNLEMEKSWELMSEFDKDELVKKKILREL